MKSAKILIVDDDPVNINLAERFLDFGGYHDFKSLLDPREVIETCQQFTPDLVLLDYHMPHINGLEVLKDLKEMHSGKKALVVMVTSQDCRQVRKGALELGADDFILKPVGIQEFISKIDNLLVTKNN